MKQDPLQVGVENRGNTTVHTVAEDLSCERRFA